MADTYCGKDCMSCDSREKLNCPGCKQGPGRNLLGDCTLAKCCRDKGHETCDTCGHNGGCFTYRDREAAPYRRIQKTEQEAQRRAATVRRAQLMGKWLKNMFWILIGGMIVNLLTMDLIKDAFPILGVIGTVGSLAASVLAGWCLLQLQELTDRYRIAGMGIIGLSIFNQIYDWIKSSDVASGLAILFGVIGVGFGIVCTYNEFHSHAESLQDISKEQSEKWLKLWKWNIILYIGCASCLILTFIPLLASLMLIVVAICSVVLSILEIVYLYRTYKCCQDFLGMNAIHS